MKINITQVSQAKSGKSYNIVDDKGNRYLSKEMLYTGEGEYEVNNTNYNGKEYKWLNKPKEGQKQGNKGYTSDYKERGKVDLEFWEKKEARQMRSIACGYVKDLIVAGKVTLDNWIREAEKISDYMLYNKDIKDQPNPDEQRDALSQQEAENQEPSGDEKAEEIPF